MNATRRLTHLTMIAATLAATFLAQAGDGVNAAHAAAPFEPAVCAGRQLQAALPTATAQLPTVTVIGRRTALVGTVQAPAVVQLPTVTVIGHRTAGDATLLAQKGARAARKTAV